MMTLLFLLVVIALVPLTIGIALLPASPPRWPAPKLGSILLCALAFNLTFFWQELWLVIPKALTPGLHPVLYHNDHGWTGHAPDVELLQGTGALATLALGLAACIVLAKALIPSPTWRCFAFWIAFQGLFQSLTQLAIGALAPGNDVGRALVYLHAGGAVRWTLLALDALAMAAAGVFLVRTYFPDPAGRSRALVGGMLANVLLATALTIPFREPRNMVEVALVPLFVNLTGAGWLALGAVLPFRRSDAQADRPIGILGPSLALGAVLLLFQLVFRPGITF